MILYIGRLFVFPVTQTNTNPFCVQVHIVFIYRTEGKS